MPCHNTTFKTWLSENATFTYSPIELFSFTAGVTSNALTVNVNTVQVTSDVSTSHINFLNYEGLKNAVPLSITSDSAGTLKVLYNGYSLATLTLDGSDSTVINLTIPTPTYTVNTIAIQFTSSDLLSMSTVYLYDDRNGTDWSITSIISDTLISSDFATFFNSYYKNWFINSENTELEDDLVLCWLSNKDRITEYATAIGAYDPIPSKQHQVAYGEHKTTNNLEDVMAQYQTDNDTTYGSRNNTDNEYEYPISGSLNSSTPSKGVNSTTTQVTDENTVTRYAHTDKHNRTITSNAHTDTTTDTLNDDPNLGVNSVKKLTDLWVFMAEQFRDCFTLHCAMTW